MKRLAIAAAVLGAIAVPVAHAAVSPAKGQVGGPPTMPLGPADEGKNITAPLVIGRGNTVDGPVEITAQGWKPPADDSIGGKQFCIWVEYPKVGEINFGTCGSATQPIHGGIEIDSEQQLVSGPKKQRYSELGGLISSKAAEVRLSYRRNGAKKQAHVVIGRVTADLQGKLKQPGQFGYFDAKVRPAVAFKSFRARAYDSSGKLLGTADHLSGQTTFAGP